MKFCPIFLALTAFMCRASGTSNKTFINGCVLTTSDIKDPYRDSLDMPYPFLNCSYLGKSSFDLSEFPEDIASISLAHNDLTTFYATDLSEFKELKKVDLRYNEISTFSYVNVTVKSVNHIYLSFNKLTKVPTEFLSSFPSLYILDLVGNRISSIRTNDFNCCKSLAGLSLSSNPLTDISDDAFQNVSSSLIGLALSFTGLREIPMFVSTMPKLVFLTLSNNKITNVQANAFRGTTYLQWLELASNKIVRIDGRAFTGINKLRFLDLTDNRIETLEPGVFDSMAEEEQLSIEMYENPLRCNCSLRWLKLWGDSLSFKDIRYKCMQPNRNHGKKSYELAATDFTCDPREEDWTGECEKTGSKQNGPTTSRPDAGNKEPESTLCPKSCKCFNSKGVQYYPKGSPQSVPDLWRVRLLYLRDSTFPQVDCSDKKLRTLPADIRTDVKTLTLEENPFGVIAIDQLREYQSLTMLDLEGCELRKVVPSSRGVVFRNLTTLLLQRNQLSTLGQDVLRSFPKLKSLRIYHNKITTLPADMFSSNRFLTRLFIGSNPVKNFDPSCLAGLDLYSLSLRNMNLTQIPLIKSKNMTFLELSDNNITVIRNNTFVRTPKLFRLDLDNNQVSVIEPAAFNKTSKLRHLDLSENRLARLPRGLFDDLEEDKVHIELWRNRIYCDCNLKWFKIWIEEHEEADPMTEVRFVCFQPWRLHGKTSNNLHPSDFQCQKNDEQYKPAEDRETAEHEYDVYEHGMCYGSGSIAAAVLLTFISTILMVLIARWCFTRRKKGYLQYRPSDEAQLDMDM